MERKDLVKKFSAGIFFILCILLVIIAIFAIGSNKGLTEPRIPMTVLFQKVSGLNPGAPVSLAGVHVGTVANIDFLDKEVDGRSVRVTLTLFKKFENQLHKGASFAILTQGVLGEKIVEITPEDGFYREDLSEPVLGEALVDLQDLAQTFGDAAATLLETSKTIDNITREMQKISATARRLFNRVEQRILDGDLFKVF
ncbi:MAG: MlaD family protein [Candidatus Omnitrophota bacterium]